MKSQIYSIVFWLMLILALIVNYYSWKMRSKFDQHKVIIQRQAVAIDSLKRELLKVKYPSLNFYLPDTIQLGNDCYKLYIKQEQDSINYIFVPLNTILF